MTPSRVDELLTGRLARVGPLVALVGGLQERRTWRSLKRHVEQQPSAVADRSPLEDRPPLPRHVAALAVARCAATTAALLARRRVHLPRQHVGLRIRFADGSTGRVYRETTVDDPPQTERCVLAVSFRLRAVRGRAHRAFEVESMLNTPLFVGFPGFVSKLWLAADGRGVYRGFYEWDQPQLAEAYARALWRVLALVSVPGSIHYRVLPGLSRDEVLDDPAVLNAVSPGPAGAWWQPIGSG